MNTSIHTVDFSQLILQLNSRNTVNGETLAEKKHQISPRWGHGNLQEIILDRLHIAFGDLTLANKQNVGVSIASPLVKMHFMLLGKTSTLNLNGNDRVAFDCNEHNIISVPNFKGIHTINKGIGFKFFEVNMSTDTFLSYLPEGVPLFSKFSDYIRRGHFSGISPVNHCITPQMHFIINDILDCSRQGAFKKVYIQAKVTELLLLQLEQMHDTKPETAGKHGGLNREKMYKAKEIIEANYSHPCSLLDLAHQVGTNDYTLKKGFKEVFGTTVFGFINDLKMERARKLLEDESITINEIANTIGYKNATHFTAAFKKKFGIVPKDLKN